MSDKNNLFKVLLSPCLTEKTNALAANRIHVFNVKEDAQKSDVKQAVEALFENVKVASVRMCRIKGKGKRFGGKIGHNQGVRKAYVTLKEGEIKLVGA